VRHSDREVVILCVGWYLRYELSYRNLVEMMAGHGLHLAHTRILRVPWTSMARPSTFGSADSAMQPPPKRSSRRHSGTRAGRLSVNETRFSTNSPSLTNLTIANRSYFIVFSNIYEWHPVCISRCASWLCELCKRKDLVICPNAAISVEKMQK
jgi:hypothetical protein